MKVEIANKTLQMHVAKNKIMPSYLIIGKNISSLRSTAEWFAKFFNPADVFWLVPKEGANTIQVAETMEFIEKAHLAPMGERKLFIITDAAAMTIAAQNKALKTIEDAPANTTFLLLASSSAPVLNTIKSRCVIIYDNSKSLNSNAETEKAAKKFLECRTLDEALPLLPFLTVKENFADSLAAIDKFAIDLPIKQRMAIINTLSIINRNVAANCNPQNAFDLLLIELFGGKK